MVIGWGMGTCPSIFKNEDKLVEHPRVLTGQETPWPEVNKWTRKLSRIHESLCVYLYVCNIHSECSKHLFHQNQTGFLCTNQNTKHRQQWITLFMIKQKKNNVLWSEKYKINPYKNSPKKSTVQIEDFEFTQSYYNTSPQISRDNPGARFNSSARLITYCPWDIYDIGMRGLKRLWKKPLVNNEELVS